MRNKSLDAGKAMAAFGVVFIHVSFPGQTGQIIKALARSAVPFFFMVSGYFCYYNRRNNDRGKRITDKIPAKVQHILTLLAFAVLFYFLWESAMHLVENAFYGGRTLAGSRVFFIILWNTGIISLWECPFF